MGKKSRRENKQPRVKRKPVPFVERPYQGLSGEGELVAMQEILPSATITARTNAEYGDREVVFVTLLPNVVSAIRRDDDVILVALQTNDRSGDASRTVAEALIQALELEPGGVLPSVGILELGPRLQDVLVPDSFGEIELHQDFEFWLSSTAERTPEVMRAIEESGERVIPSAEVADNEGAYWCSMNREFVRWVRSENPERVLDGLGRLAAKRANTFEVHGGEAKFVGAFRAAGLIVPVWELPEGTEAEELAAPMTEFAKAVDAAIAEEDALDADARRARAGIVSRQVSL